MDNEATQDEVKLTITQREKLSNYRNTMDTNNKGEKNHPINGSDKPWKTIREGLAEILVPETRGDKSTEQAVFYNPVQQFNRDLSVLFIRVFGEELIESRENRCNDTLSKKRARRSRPRKRQKSDSACEASSDKFPSDNSTIERAKIQSVEESLEENFLDDDEFVDDMQLFQIEQNSLHQAASLNNISSTQSFTLAKLRILDALSATGLRALRYALELPFQCQIVANDLSDKATKMIKLNAEHNSISIDQLAITTESAQAHLYTRREKYDIIDLDPYGSAIPFIDSALQAISSGGLLCITCTDASLFASAGYPEKSYALYNGLPMRGVACHEAGLRLILHAVSVNAAKYGLTIEPLLSLSIDFYARLFIRVTPSPARVKFLAGQTVIVYNCDAGCGAWAYQTIINNQQVVNGKSTYYRHSIAQAPSAYPQCPFCTSKTHLAGPMYAGRLHNPKYIKRILDLLPCLDNSVYPTIPRIQGMLQTALEEIFEQHSNNEVQFTLVPTSDVSNNVPRQTSKPTDENIDPLFLYTQPSAMAKALRCVVPAEAAIKGALRSAGFIVARSHARPGSLKTNATWYDLWYIMSRWASEHCSSSNPPSTTSPIFHLRQTIANAYPEAQSSRPSSPTTLSGWPTYPVNFDLELGRDNKPLYTPKTQAGSPPRRILRYQLNPQPFWGPQKRAKS